MGRTGQHAIACITDIEAVAVERTDLAAMQHCPEVGELIKRLSAQGRVNDRRLIAFDPAGPAGLVVQKLLGALYIVRSTHDDDLFIFYVDDTTSPLRWYPVAQGWVNEEAPLSPNLRPVGLMDRGASRVIMFEIKQQHKLAEAITTWAETFDTPDKGGYHAPSAS